MQKKLSFIWISTFLTINLSFLFIQTGTVNGQNNRQPVRENNSQKGIALVIGNSNYKSARKLDNPVNDATDMASTLKTLGFEVISGTDLNRRQMAEKVREFGDRLRISKGVGLFYYAGHGIQVKNSNYLIPVNAEIPREDEVEFAALNLNFVMQKMATANNGLNIVILDACRNNPFARGWSRSADEGGLAQVTAPTGTFIAYATAPNMTASDGNGRNGLYTAQLLNYLKRPGLKIEDIFKQVTIAVDRTSGGRQVPWTSSSLRGEFFFNIDGKQVAVKTPVISKPVTKNKTATNAESASWELVKDSTDPGYLQLYLDEFPKGVYATAAKIKLKKIEKDAWDLVKDTEDANKIQEYLNKYPKGENAPIARIIVKKLKDKKTQEKEEKPETTGPPWLKKNSMGTEYLVVYHSAYMHMGWGRLELIENEVRFSEMDDETHNAIYPCNEMKEITMRGNSNYRGIKLNLRNGKGKSYYLEDKNKENTLRKIEYLKRFCGI